MKQLRTKLAAALLALALVLGCVPAALATVVSARAGNIDLTLNGTDMKLGTYNIANSNYVKLRDVAQLFKGTGKEFSVTWNGADQRIELTSGAAYQSVGGELASLPAGMMAAAPNTASVWLDGEPVSLTAYTINNNNFFKLRDLGYALNFAVDWDASTGFVIVDTNQPYTGEAPVANSNSAMARAMLDALNDSYDACLADVDGDGVLELLTAGRNGVSLYDWKGGALQTVWSFEPAGAGCDWYLCKNTETGERGLEFYNYPSGDLGNGGSTFTYPSRTFRIYSRLVLDDNDYPIGEASFYRDGSGDRSISQAEFDKIRIQNQRIELLMGDSGSKSNIAAVRAELNGML